MGGGGGAGGRAVVSVCGCGGGGYWGRGATVFSATPPRIPPDQILYSTDSEADCSSRLLSQQLFSASMALTDTPPQINNKVITL